jgi:hypothetical protein
MSQETLRVAADRIWRCYEHDRQDLNPDRPVKDEGDNWPFIGGLNWSSFLHQALSAPTTQTEDALRAAVSILLSGVDAVMPEVSPYGCPHSRDWLNGVLDGVRSAASATETAP